MNPTNTLALLLVCLSVTLAGCNPGGRRAVVPGPTYTPVTTTTAGPVEGRPTAGQPILLPPLSLTVVPFVVERPEGWIERAFSPTEFSSVSGGSTHRRRSNSGYRASGLGDVRWHNALLIDPVAGTGALLLNKKAQILGFGVLTVEPEEREALPEIRHLLFEVARTDTNGDGRLDADDASVALIVEPDGSGARAVTPAGMHLVYAGMAEPLGGVLFGLRRDADGDSTFTTADPIETWFLRNDAAPGDLAKPLVDADLVERATDLLK